jgi:hypothetical protein
MPIPPPRGPASGPITTKMGRDGRRIIPRRAAQVRAAAGRLARETFYPFGWRATDRPRGSGQASSRRRTPWVQPLPGPESVAKWAADPRLRPPSRLFPFGNMSPRIRPCTGSGADVAVTARLALEPCLLHRPLGPIPAAAILTVPSKVATPVGVGYRGAVPVFTATSLMRGWNAFPGTDVTEVTGADSARWIHHQGHPGRRQRKAPIRRFAGMPRWGRVSGT